MPLKSFRSVCAKCRIRLTPGTTHPVRPTVCRSCYRRHYGPAQDSRRGLGRDPLYVTWANMLQRHRKPAPSDRRRFPGGVPMDPVWAESFAAFRDWALAAGWRKGLRVVRGDPDGPFGPDNSVVTTAAELAALARAGRMRFVSYRGRTESLSTWARRFGRKPALLIGYVHEYGLEEAFRRLDPEGR